MSAPGNPARRVPSETSSERVRSVKMKHWKCYRSRHRRAGARFLLVALLAAAVACVTVVLGKPAPCPAPTEEADAQIARLHALGMIRDDDPLARDLGEWERYCDYIDRLRGDLL